MTDILKLEIDRQVDEFKQPETIKESPDTLEVLGAAFERENSIGSLLSNIHSDFGVDEDYNPLTDIKDDEQWIPYADRFATSDSRDETEWLKAKITKENQNRKFIDNADGWGITASIAAGVLDPINLIPLVGAGSKVANAGTRLARFGQGFKAGAVVGVQSTALSEGILQSTQETRTAEESVTAIIAGSLLGGVLVGGVKALPKGRYEQIKQEITDDLLDRTPTPKDGGAAATKQTTLDDEALTGYPGMNTGFNVTANVDFAQSASVVVRRIGQKLFRDPFTRNKNKDGIANEQALETRLDRYNGMTAGFRTDMKKFYNEFKDTVEGAGKYSFAEFNGFVAKVMRRQTHHAKQQKLGQSDALEDYLSKVGSHVTKKYLDPLYQRAVDEDLDVGEGVKDYFPQLWEKSAILSNQQGFDDALVNWLGLMMKNNEKLTPRDYPRIAQLIRTSILNINDGDIAFNINRILPESARIKERQLNIPTNMLDQFEDFMVSDTENVIRSYIRSMSVEIETNKVFNGGKWADIVDEINLDYEKLKQANPDNGIALDKQRIKDIEGLKGRLDVLTGNNTPPNTFTKLMLGLNTATMLGGVLISSLPELAMRIVKNGLKNSSKAFKASLLDTDFRKFSREELQSIGVGIESIENTRLNQLAYGDYHTKGTSDAATNMMPSVVQKFMKATGLPLWTDLGKLESGRAATFKIRDALMRYNADDAEFLAQLGVGKKDATRALDAFDESWRNSSKDNGFPKFGAITDEYSRELIELAILKQVQSTIITPSVGTIPKWVHEHPSLRLVFQFKSFLVAMHENYLLAGMQKPDANFMLGTAAMVFLGGVASVTKSRLRYFDDDGKYDELMRKYKEEPTALLYDSIDQSGALSVPTEISNIMSKTVGFSPMQQAFGVDEAQRFASRNDLGALLGPTIGQLNNTSSVMSAANPFSEKEWTKSTTHTARKLIPFQNLFYTRQIFDNAEKLVNEKFNVEK